MSDHENDSFLQMDCDSDVDISELYDQERLSEDDELEIIDPAESGEDDQNRSTNLEDDASQTIDTESADVEVDRNAEFTLSVLINGNLFVLEADPARGKCTICNRTYRTTNKASDLTRHLVSLNSLISKRPINEYDFHTLFFI